MKEKEKGIGKNKNRTHRKRKWASCAKLQLFNAACGK